VPSRLGALGDDHVHADLDLLDGMAGGGGQRGHLDPLGVRQLDDVGGRRAKGVGQQRDGVPQRHLDLRPGGGVRPAEQDLAGVGVLGQRGHAVPREQVLDELPVALGDHPLQARDQLLRCEVGPLVGGGHDHVDAVRLAVHVVVDPLELHLELFRGEVEGAQHAHPSGAADGRDDVPAVAEGEDR
jgi:hypothetical protein